MGRDAKGQGLLEKNLKLQRALPFFFNLWTGSCMGFSRCFFLDFDAVNDSFELEA